MHVLPHYSRILLLTEGRLGVLSSKTAASLLRYRARDVVGIVDSSCAGRDVRDVIPWAPPVPIVADLAGAPPADSLFIGVAPVGGELPPDMRRHVRAAIEGGVDVVNGLHTRLADDAELSAAAARSGARLLDLRRPPFPPVIASGRARQTRCRRILTVGSDCNVGKMVAALELTAAARRAGRDARFVATGQTGIMICGRGIAVDAVVADFVAGAAEQLALDAADGDLCFIEGQGSLGHPGYSGVTLSLLHGTCPDALVLVHHAGRTHHAAEPHHPLPDLLALRDAYERAAALLHPARIVAMAVNTFGLDDAEAHRETQRLGAHLGLPAQDVLRDGCGRLLDALFEAVENAAPTTSGRPA